MLSLNNVDIVLLFIYMSTDDILAWQIATVRLCRSIQFSVKACYKKKMLAYD